MWRISLAWLPISSSTVAEGYAVDDAAGVFYTNLEDKDRTLANRH